MDEFDKRVAAFLAKGTFRQKPTTNARVLVSRNKREGWYEGNRYSYSRGRKKHCRGGTPASRVNFAELCIQLHNPLEAQNGTAIP